jgi:hypothetical protein
MNSINILGLASTLLFVGCAATVPQSNLDAADRYLSGACKEMFLARGYAKYQSMASNPLGQSVMALAVDSKTGKQSCGMATNNSRDVKESQLEITTSWEKLDTVAISRCEAAKPSDLNAPCLLIVAPFSQESEPPQNPGRFSLEGRTPEQAWLEGLPTQGKTA